MIKQMIKIAMMMVMVIGLMASSATARNEIRDDDVKGFVYDGVESSAGNQDPVSGFHYGNAFVLSSVREVESRYLNVSINSREMFLGVGVTGGTWSVAVFRDGGNVGTVYGEILAGEIQDIIGEKGQRIGKQIRIDLRATGGTGIFDNDESQNISGSLTITVDLLAKKKIATAVETLNF